MKTFLIVTYTSVFAIRSIEYVVGSREPLRYQSLMRYGSAWVPVPPRTPCPASNCESESIWMELWGSSPFQFVIPYPAGQNVGRMGLEPGTRMELDCVAGCISESVAVTCNGKVPASP